MDSSPLRFPLEFENYFKAEDYSFEHRSFESFHICSFVRGLNRIHRLPNPNSAFADKIHSVLARTQLFCPSSFLCQFWTAVIRDERCLLATRNRTFILNFEKNFRDGLCEYRMVCKDCECHVDSDVEEDSHGILGREFRHKSIEATPMLGYYPNQQYPLRDLAQSCGIKSSIAVLVFESSKLCYVGVLGPVSRNDYPSYPTELICKELRDVGLAPLIVPANHWERKYEKIEREMLHGENKIRKTFKERYKFLEVQLCQAWAPCTSCNNAFNGDVMIGLLFHQDGVKVRYDLLHLSNISFAYHFRKGQDIVWGAVSSGMLTLCMDMNKLDITDYPLAHFARYNDLNGCLVIPLQSNCIEHNVYVLEFFFKDSGDPYTLLHKILKNMKKHLLNFKVTFGQELRGNLPIIVIDSLMNARCDFIQIAENEELVQCPIIDAMITGRNDVIHEQSSILNSIQRIDEKASIQQFLMDAMVTKRNNLSQDPNNIPHFIQISRERGSMHQPSVDALMLGRSDVIKEPNKLLSSCSKQGGAIDTTRIEHKELGIPIGMSNMNELQTAVGEAVQQCLFGQPLEDLVNTLTHVAGGNPNGNLDLNLQRSIAIKIAGKRCRKSGIPITLENIQQQFGKKLKDAATSLNVSRSTDNVSNEDVPQDQVLPIDLNSPYQLPQDQVLPIDLNLPYQPPVATVTSKMQNYIPLESTNKVNVKVKCGDKVAIRFQLSLASGIAGLKQQVEKRLSGIDFENNSFQYMDEENDWISMLCDEDLHYYLTSSTSSTKTSVTIYLKPFNFFV